MKLLSILMCAGAFWLIAKAIERAEEELVLMGARRQLEAVKTPAEMLGLEESS